MKRVTTVATAEQAEIIIQKLEKLESQYTEICRAAREDVVHRLELGKEIGNIERLINAIYTVMQNQSGPQTPIILCNCPKDSLMS